MSVDPATTKLSSVSPYAYAANNPIIYKDPDEREIIIYYMRNGENKNMFTIQVFLFLLLKKALEEKAAVDDTNIINSILDEETKSSRGGKNAKCQIQKLIKKTNNYEKSTFFNPINYI